MKSVLLLFSVILVSACVSQQEIKEITIPGHGNQIYTFSHDIRLAAKVFSNDEYAIRNVFANDSVPLVFDGSNQQDNAFFTVVATNLGKIQTYFAYEGRLFSFEPYYFLGEKWYDRNGAEIGKPGFANALWLKGPATGANETSVTINNGIVYLQGTSYQNLTLAGDKLVLIVFEYQQPSF